MARPKVLDEAKLQTIRVLVAAGMSFTRIAEHVGCDVKTIRRYRQQNPQFDAELRRRQAKADTRPLESVRRAAATNWRAAAWMLEREDRRQVARRDPQQAGIRDLARVAQEWVAEWNRGSSVRQIESVEIVVQLAGHAENNVVRCSLPQEQSSRENKG